MARSPQDPDIKDREGTQPAAYHRGLKKSTKTKRDAHFKKGAKMDDNNPNAYKDAPGDKEARAKGMKKSKYTKYVDKMMGESLRSRIAKNSSRFPERSSVRTSDGKKGKVMTVGKDFVKVAHGNKMKDYHPSKLTRESEQVDEYFTSKQIKQARGIANDPRHKGGDYTGAAKKMEKIKKGLSRHPAAMKALRKANEGTDFAAHRAAQANKPRLTKSDSDKMAKVAAMMKKEREKRMKEDISEEAGKSLAAKAKKSGISVGTLRKVYNRGVAAWRTGHRPGTTPSQWGHARVNAFITKKKRGGLNHDQDLAKEGYVSHAQRKAVWASKADGGKGHPDKKKKLKEDLTPQQQMKLKNLEKRAKSNPQAQKRLDAFRKELGMGKSPAAKKAAAPAASQRGSYDKADRNIIMQLRKAVDVGGNMDLMFHMGKRGRVSKSEAENALKFHDRLPPNGKRMLRIRLAKGGPAAVKQAAQAYAKASVREDKGPCWDGYKKVGMKKKGNKMVNNCVPEELYPRKDRRSEEQKRYENEKRKRHLHDKKAAASGVETGGREKVRKEAVDRANSEGRGKGYSTGAQRNKAGGYRAHIKTPDGKTSYLGGASYKTAAHAKGEADAYHKAYHGHPSMKANDRGATNAVHKYRQANAKHRIGESFMKRAKDRIGREKEADARKHDRQMDRARLRDTLKKNRES